MGQAQVIAPPSVGQQAAISGHMATQAYKSGKKVQWDERAEKLRYL